MTDLNTADARLVVPAARTLTEDQSIRPFRVTIPEKELVELRRRIAAARWPTKELVEDRSQGVQLATLRELTRYWTTEYDWRKVETRLNALPQFTTKIDGVEIHFAVLADAHRRLGRPVVLGVRTGSGRSRAAGKAPPVVSVPVGFTTFPGEIWAAPRSWVDTVYPGLAYFNEVDRDGHFAAWEQPALFVLELRAAFKSIR